MTEQEFRNMQAQSMTVLNDLFYEALKLSKNVKSSTTRTLAKGMKLGEEFGEFSETVLKEVGMLPHKQVKEPPVNEACDMILVILDILGGLHEDKSEQEIVAIIAEAFQKKLQKWYSLRAMGVDFIVDEK